MAKQKRGAAFWLRLGLKHQSCSRRIRTDYHELFSQNTHEHREILSFCLFVRLFPAVPI